MKHDDLVMDSEPLLADIISRAVSSFNFWTNSIAEYELKGKGLDFMVWFCSGAKDQSQSMYDVVSKSIDEGKY